MIPQGSSPSAKGRRTNLQHIYAASRKPQAGASRIAGGPPRGRAAARAGCGIGLRRRADERAAGERSDGRRAHGPNGRPNEPRTRGTQPGSGSAAPTGARTHGLSKRAPTHGFPGRVPTCDPSTRPLQTRPGQLPFSFARMRIARRLLPASLRTKNRHRRQVFTV